MQSMKDARWRDGWFKTKCSRRNLPKDRGNPNARGCIGIVAHGYLSVQYYAIVRFAS